MKKNLNKIISFCLSGGDIPVGKHCTLWFKPMKSVNGETEYEKNARLALVNTLVSLLGDEIGYEEMEVLSDSNVTCVTLALEQPVLYREESVPHVTMEVSEGCSPVQSIDLINTVGVERAVSWTPTHIAVLSVMYYDRNGKQYSISSNDWI